MVQQRSGASEGRDTLSARYRPLCALCQCRDVVVVVLPSAGAGARVRDVMRHLAGEAKDEVMALSEDHGLQRGRVVVTGGAGFIGSHLVRALLSGGWEVVVVDDLSSGREENLDEVKDDIAWYEGDILDSALLARVMRGANAVCHHAALVQVVASVHDPVRCHEVNGRGTLNVLLAARDAGVRRVVFAASAAAYGTDPSLPSRESDRVAPVSPYAATKLLGEHYCGVFTSVYGVPSFPLRYFNIYGARQDPSGPYSGVISKFVDRMVAGEPPVMFGDGTQTRDFCHVSDVVRANLAALQASSAHAGQPINIGTGRETSLMDLASALGRVFGVDVAPEFRPAREGDVHRSVADLSEASRRLSYHPETTLEAGLADVVAWTRGA